MKKINNVDGQSIQPYIIAVGNAILPEAAMQIIVVLDKNQYLVNSGKEAIDLCFKLFQVLSARYPPAGEHIRELISQGLYKYNSKFEKNTPAYMDKIYAAVGNKNFSNDPMVET